MGLRSGRIQQATPREPEPSAAPVPHAEFGEIRIAPTPFEREISPDLADDDCEIRGQERSAGLAY